MNTEKLKQPDAVKGNMRMFYEDVAGEIFNRLNTPEEQNEAVKEIARGLINIRMNVVSEAELTIEGLKEEINNNEIRANNIRYHNDDLHNAFMTPVPKENTLAEAIRKDFGS